MYKDTGTGEGIDGVEEGLENPRVKKLMIRPSR